MCDSDDTSSYNFWHSELNFLSHTCYFVTEAFLSISLQGNPSYHGQGKPMLD